MDSPLALHTRIEDLYRYKLARLGQVTSRKLAAALASFSGKKNSSDATIEDLLGYLPMRYEDRSNLARIRDLKDGVEASLELYVKLSGAYESATVP